MSAPTRTPGTLAGSALVVYLLAMALNGFDATVVGPALPDIATGVGTDAHGVSAVEWVFLIASAVALPSAGWLARRFGTERVLLATLAVFTLGCAWAAFATGLVDLSLARAVQGAASGVLTPVALATVYAGASGADRLRIARVTTVPLTVAPMLGPVVGGFVATHLGWRWVFGVLVPIGLLAVGLAATRVAATRVAATRGTGADDTTEREPFDLGGFGLWALGFSGIGTCSSLLVGALGSGGRPLLVVGLATGLAVSAAALLLAVRVARSTSRPALDLGLWQDQAFRWAGLAVATGAAGLMGLLYLVPLLLRAHGASAAQVGLAMVPETVGVLLGAQLMPRLLRSVGPRALSLGGTLGAAVAALLLVSSAGVATPWLTGGLLLALAIALSQPVLLAQAVAFSTVRPSATTDATAAFIAQRTLLSSAGVLLAATPLALVPLDLGWVLATVAVAECLLVSAWCVLRLPARTWREALAEQPPG